MPNASDKEIINRWKRNTQPLRLAVYETKKELGIIFKRTYTKREYIIDNEIFLNTDFEITSYKELLPTFTIHELLKQSGYEPIPIDSVQLLHKIDSKDIPVLSILDKFQPTPSINIRKIDYSAVYQKLVDGCNEVSLKFTFSKDEHKRVHSMLVQTDQGQEDILISKENQYKNPFNQLSTEKRIFSVLQPLFKQLHESGFILDEVSFKEELSSSIKSWKSCGFSISRIHGTNYRTGNEKGSSNSQQNHENSKNNKNKKQEYHALEQYYKLLGVTPSSSRDAVTRAYRAQAKKFHPDTIQGKNLDDEFIEFATLKFKNIQQAYSEICVARNWT
ncbi:MAG: DnaJ domain-containing protein [Sphaerochaeta associata]|uniref:DnaJ domain-containing protein n=1 Tax=Sphaerochaeta associata TaxID=1129264 RepID=UPI002B1FFE49|nr:DnaJ domain-containing protein [Sphaerochaeta associata]MEA5028579.1 DnaJ domain-containing protein [Sphaerochaeta associata]